ncbi:MAG: enoyl-CoA hydratase-related protein [Chloroflexi bacterium]|nr:enoyl-CoA hydratase-related protein [Chloroflexota bacterium]
MAYSTVLIEKQGRVGWLILNRPEARNALNKTMLGEIPAALKELDKDADVGAIIIRGAGDKAFCAGADLKELVGKSTLELREQFGGVAEVIETMAGLTKPVIGAVRGYALAGGIGLAAACDMVVAAEDAKFGAPEVKIGLFPMTIMPVLTRSMGRKKAFEFLMVGEMVDAAEAEHIGLVNKVVPVEQLEEAALDLANKIASKSPLVISMGRHAFYNAGDMEYLKAVWACRDLVAVLASTEDSNEGRAAFLEKREPQYKGR